MQWGLIIDISWSDRKLEKTCASETSGQRSFGADGWKITKRRLSSLIAAPTLGAMDGVPGKCHALSADRAGQFAVNLGGAMRLVFAPDHDPVPRLEDGGINTSLVTRS